MKRWCGALLVLALSASSARADEGELVQKEDDAIHTLQRCSGMYGPKSWAGDVDPYIQASLDKVEVEGDADPVVSLIIFEWKDLDFIGKLKTPAAAQKETICDDENVNAKLCNETQIGEFILADGAGGNLTTRLITQAVHLKDAVPVKYPIRRTGYYCVATYGHSSDRYRAVVEFRNAYGELPAAQIAKLPFYGGITVVYAVMAAFWAFLYAQHRHDILAVQNYITAILVFLIVEMGMTWGFYDYQNRHGSNALARVLMVVVAVLNAWRNSFSFFLLLIVCMGYGVVKPSLGKAMLYVRGLAIAHFVFGVIYAVASLTITPDSAGPLVLLVILPLAGTLTAFYVWTLNALGLTLKDLVDRKQTVKAMMYKKLWWCILTSIMVIFGFFFFNSFTFAGRSDPDFVPNHWKTRWFILDGWLNLVYMVDLGFVAYLWRPTANNRRFAMSDEATQDDEGFEIASFGGSLDEEEGGRTPRGGGPDDRNGSVSPLPPQASADKPAPPPRASLDGETIFAVGEGDDDADKWSDDGAGDGEDGASPRGGSSERTRLTAGQGKT
ncbi:MAG: hypothetical protein M1832_004269 [Thelocarpon impressellum]|nr:MAG: hypothetical protein M1832_004269 [Thelocarpon impressellum]